MKKTIHFSLAILFVAFTFIACSKNPEKVLPSKTGIWNYDETTTVLSTTATASGTATFDKETVTFQTGSGSKKYTWTYDSDNERITITSTTSAAALTFVITDMTRNSETWTYTDKTSGFTIVRHLKR
jgi:hypothetical protein